jgi:hypothetical protein
MKRTMMAHWLVGALTCLALGAARAAEPSKPVLDPLLKPEVRNSPARETPGLLERMLAGPLKEVPAVICVLKNDIGGAGIEGDFGWTLHTNVANPKKLYGEAYDPKAEGLSFAEKQSLILPKPKFGAGPSRILRVDLRTRQISTLFEDPDGGVVRDPCVSYDGRKIVLAMRKAKECRYHLFEIDVDGRGLRQLTDGPDDEVEPCYLPDGGIVYASSKAHRFTPCNAHQVANIWRCDADGGNQRRLTNGMDAERSPWVMADGRVSFARWDYVHRDQMTYFGLWSINPDGTGHMIVSGNYNFYAAGWPGYAKPIPGTDRLVCALMYVHDIKGMVATIDPSLGPDNIEGVRLTSLGNPRSTVELINETACGDMLGTNKALHWRAGTGPDSRSLAHQMGWTDPYPISEDCFLVTNYGDGRNELCVMDGAGNYEVVCTVDAGRPKKASVRIETWDVTLSGSSVLAGVRPLMARAREPVIVSRTDYTKATGTMVLANIHEGRQFASVKPGTIRALMVMENLPTPIRFGDATAVSLGEQWNVSKYWGSVPVESDGSAHFEVPALRSLSLIAVDDAGREVKAMRTQVNVMPGETVGCVGCHERRTKTPSTIYSATLAALNRPASVPTIPKGIRHTPVSYGKDIQPILDKYCVKCHSAADPQGKIILEGDRTPKWSVAYSQLFAARQIATVGDPGIGDDRVGPIAAAVSPLLKYLNGGHQKVQATLEELLTVRIWIDEDAKYGPYTMTSWSGRMSPEDPTPPCDTKVLMKRCDSCHAGPAAEGPDMKDANGRYCGMGAWPVTNRQTFTGREDSLINLDRPDKSLLLRAPPAKEAGGLGWCQQTDAKSKGGKYAPKAPAAMVFGDANDPDYQQLLASVRTASGYFAKNIRRFDMPGYRPNDFLVRYYRNWGIIPKDYDVAKQGWDAEALDDLYFNYALFPDTQSAPGPTHGKEVTR